MLVTFCLIMLLYLLQNRVVIDWNYVTIDDILISLRESLLSNSSLSYDMITFSLYIF